MKLIIAIAHNREQARVADALIQAGFAFTKLGSTGGFLRQGSTTLLIGVDEVDVPKVMDILKKHCHKAERYVSVAPDPNPAISVGTFSSQPLIAEEGGGIAFVLDAASVERF
jgi:uncharacterized protein YaaQ